MKIPAVAIAASFLGGILLGLYPLLSQYAASRSFLLAIAICCAFILLLGLILATLDFLRLAALSCLLSWVALGTFASCIAQQPLPTNHILQRIKAGEINLKSPLRWHGHLTDEPSRLPWGYSVDIALTGVEAHDMLLSVRGGMRLGFTPNDHDPQFPVVHAGDEISVLMQARLPLLYRDAGAF